MITIIQSGSQTWAVAAAGGDLHVYSREEAGEWIEVFLSEDSEQLDRDGSSILEALYEQYATTDQNGRAAAPEAEQEEPEDEEEEPADEEEEPEDEEPEEEEKKPRRSRARTRTRKK